MKSKRFKISSVILYFAFINIFFFLCSFAVMAQESEGFADDGNIVGLNDPFSSPALPVDKKLDDETNSGKKASQSVNPVMPQESPKGVHERSSDQKPKAEVKEPGVVKVDVAPDNASALPPVTVSGIIFSESKSLAIIEGDVYAVGDVVILAEGEAKVFSIEKKHVVLVFNGISYKLEVEGRSQKRSSSKKRKNVGG